MFVIICVLVAVLGGAVGSFAGVIATRGWRGSVAGRSHCDGCGRTLLWYELIPFLSYAALRGRCRTCHARVAWGVLAWEVGGGVLALAVVVLLLLSGTWTL